MTQQNNDGNGRRPDFIAYNVRPAKDENHDAHWNRIGAAWQHRDGKGYEVKLDSLPVDGRVSLRAMREERMQKAVQERQARVSDHDPQLEQGGIGYSPGHIR
ncbi:MAG: hypothetical protein JAZ18_01930 [Candidatus Thiodiazotropha endolucinida]|nr:hypothetical protein [Candidatus Thiodiazotropha endolucinida]